MSSGVPHPRFVRVGNLRWKGGDLSPPKTTARRAFLLALSAVAKGAQVHPRHVSSLPYRALATTCAIPTTIEIAPITRAKTGPRFHSFSMAMIAATATITVRLMTPNII